MQNTMSNGKEFPIGAILSVTTKYGIPAEGYSHFFDGIIDVLNFMTGESLYSHAAIRASDAARPYLFEWYPELQNVDPSDWEWKNETHPRHYSKMLTPIIEKLGKYLMIWQIPSDDYEPKDPYQEAIDLGHKGEIIEFNANDSEDDISPYGDLPSKN